MSGFVIWATLCAAIAATFVALPFWRARGTDPSRQRAVGIIVGALVALSAALLYPLWSNWSWRATPTSATAVDEDLSIAGLTSATSQNPQDIQAWLNLGRAYLRIQQWPLARRSFQRADTLGQGKNAAALSGLAETIVFENNGTETDATVEMFDRALKLDPHSAQALFYTGVALLHAGDLENSRSRFSTLRDLHPPAQVVDALDKQIAAIDVEIARLKPDPATAIHLLVDIAPALKEKVPAGASLFVFVRAPQGGAPLAVKRLGAEFPQTVELSANDSMIPSSRITPGQRVQVMARVTASGTPTASAGDLFGELKAVAGVKGQRELIVDRQSP